jgi:hypothetical protein
MATYDSLTTEQKALVQAFLNFARGWCGEQARTNNHGEAANDDYNAQVSAILATLDDGEIIPNTSGLAGAASINENDLISVVSHIQGIQTNYNTSAHRQLWTKMAGAGNLIG